MAVARTVKTEKKSVKNVVRLEVGHPKGAVHAALLRRASHRYLKALSLSGVELSLTLVTDRAMRRLNRTWRGKDKPTDVLSFPGGDAPAGAPGPRLLGDVVISLDTAVRQAKEQGRPLTEELRRYLAHGILHLLGHDHEQGPRQAKEMAALEQRLLGRQGMVPG